MGDSHHRHDGAGDADGLASVSLGTLATQTNVSDTISPSIDDDSRVGRSYLPKNWKCSRGEVTANLKEIVKLAAPIGLGLLVTNLMNFQTLLFAGHAPNRTDNETRVILDAAALATSFGNVTGAAVLIGASTACDTLYAQAFGGKNKKSLGIIVQQSILILSLLCLAISGLWLNSEAVLLGVGQSPEVARLAAVYMDIIIFSLPGLLGVTLSSRYLQAQSITIPIIVIGFIANGVLALADYLLVIQFDLGLRGAGIGYVLAMTLQPVLILLYIKWRKLHTLTWPGWSWKCLDNWAVFVRLALAGGVMVCLEWWSFEIMLFGAGLLGETPLAISSVLYQLIYLTIIVAVGMMIATNILIGNQLGSGNWQKARLTFRVALVTNACNGLLMALGFVLLRNQLGKIFTSDPEIIQGVADVIPILAALELFDYLQTIGSGAIRGAGRQTIGAVSNLISYYVFALPVGMPLALKTPLGVRGFWIGMMIGLFFQTTFYMIIISRIDWQEESVRAQKRVKVAAGDYGSDAQEAAVESPVELLAVMRTTASGEVQCRITGKGAAASLDDGAPGVSSTTEDDRTGDTDALIASPEGVKRQSSTTDELYESIITPRQRRRLLIKKLQVSVVPLLILTICLVVRLVVPVNRADADAGADADATNITIGSNATSLFLSVTNPVLTPAG